ncbi:hypothetical protein RRG08_062380 [Elysia crispata]|uniref:Uncharacterized protein n=1 Tax=Elysia crispata TaxID=231223 RepID=A0AAE0YGA5_9GAST|nr:hypothetical protein RRG08_062380 [Elysia crispata]
MENEENKNGHATRFPAPSTVENADLEEKFDRPSGFQVLIKLESSFKATPKGHVYGIKERFRRKHRQAAHSGICLRSKTFILMADGPQQTAAADVSLPASYSSLNRHERLLESKGRKLQPGEQPGQRDKTILVPAIVARNVDFSFRWASSTPGLTRPPDGKSGEKNGEVAITNSTDSEPIAC